MSPRLRKTRARSALRKFALSFRPPRLEFAEQGRDVVLLPVFPL